MLLDEFKIVEVAALCCVMPRGRVLSVRKGSSPRFQMPGGKLEAHESPLEAALREVREEVGLDLKKRGYTAPRRFQCAGLKRAWLYGGFPRIYCRGSL